jgi:nicotinate-nucleotide adenylyltransferase
MKEDAYDRPPRKKREEVVIPDPWPNDDGVKEAMEKNAGLTTARRQRLVVFGGSFDPVHLGHVALARQILEHQLADEVMFIPAKQSPLKAAGSSLPGKVRMEMLELAIDDALREKPSFTVTNLDGDETQVEYRFSTSDLELKRDGDRTYTIETMEILHRLFSDMELLFLMGTDNLFELQRWHRYGELLRNYDFIIYPRPGEYLNLARAQSTAQGAAAGPNLAFQRLIELYGAAFAAKLQRSVLPTQEYPMMDIASSDIRRAIANGGAPARYLSPSVWSYICQNHLYQKA